MKVHILYKLTDSPLGGGNQFLKALKKRLRKREMYEENINEADIVLFNGHQHAHEVLMAYKAKKPNQKFVHRLDGLQKLYNRPDDERQDIAFQLNKFCSDGNIFQSNWILKKFIEQGFVNDKKHAVIYNAVDDEIFTKKRNKELFGKIKLVTTSWSTNPNKGFDIYKYLDDNLDFDKYEYHYIGNMPDGLKFKNIIVHPPMTTKQIALFLPECDIFISASKHECLSNSIIEAVSCGLPCLVRDSGSNSEAIGDAGVYFDGKRNVLTQLKLVSENIYFYGIRADAKTIDEVTDEYIQFFEHCLKD